MSDSRGLQSALIEPEALAVLLEHAPEGLKIVDASYAFSPTGGAPFEYWLENRIADAVFFDIDAIADAHNPLPHMVPTAEDFGHAMEALGISTGDQVIIYDQTGMSMAAARVWWMFRLFGHDEVKVLNGGLHAWQQFKLPMNNKPPTPVAAPGMFVAGYRPSLLRAKRHLMKNLEADSETAETVVDARSNDRFRGESAEPRPALRPGHIPGSINMPYTQFLDSYSGQMKPRAELAEIFKTLPAGRPVVASCGSGVTACVIALAAYEAGRADVAIYDGSWTEWGHILAGTPVDNDV